MRHYLLIALIALSVSFGFTQLSFAVCGGATPFFFCDDSPPNPDTVGIQQASNIEPLFIDVTAGAEIDVDSGNCLNLSDNGDEVNITDAVLSCENHCVDPRGGPDTVNINGGMMTCDNRCVTTGGGPDTVNVDGTVFNCDGRGINTSFNEDIVNIRNVVINSGPGTSIRTGGDNDVVNVFASVLNSFNPNGVIRTEAGNDMVELGTGAAVNGLIDCGTAFDTIIFEMDVPEDQLIVLTNEIIFANPAGDSIEINGLTYEWINCELLVPELNGVPIEPRPIPTLSQWGLIATAGVLGLVGLYAVGRRRATA